jgi:hypothetical protein
MTVIWNTPAGSLGTLVERVIVDIPLSAFTDSGQISYSLISGSLPRGLRLVNGSIKGSPVEVKKFTVSRFVVRASNGVEISDRTFSISVDGSDIPEWITREGFLNVGPGDAYFVLDNARVDFQLEATDTDILAGESLEYYLLPRGGFLPPGLSLSKDGKISGFTDPVFSVEYAIAPSGAYDGDSYDTLPLDLVRRNSNGYDTFTYDFFTFDYNEPSQPPRRLSRFYTFAVAVTDGLNIVTRIFKIYVVTEEFLKADNNILQVDTNLFQADASAFRTPIWITDSYLGRYRANNYITIFLDVFNPPEFDGTLLYFLLPTNPGRYRFKDSGVIIENGAYEISGEFPIDPSIPPGNVFVTDPDDWEVLIPETVAVLPPGLAIDTFTGEIAGPVPYQDRVTRNYQFSVLAIRFPDALPDNVYNFVGEWSATRSYQVNDTVLYAGQFYVATSSNRNITPVNTDFWRTASTSSTKTFSIDIIGEIESAIRWITPSDRGTIKPNQPSGIFVEAENLLRDSELFYEFVSGELPPGLEFLPNGLIKGKVRQYSDDNGPGLLRFFEIINGANDFDVVFDNGTTSFDKVFNFTIKARDSARAAENVREFSIQVISENDKTFSNLYLTALQPKNKRLEWFNFITNPNIFLTEDLYRPGDTNFGVQTDLRVLLYAGIESVEAVKFVQAMSRNHYRKRLFFGDVKLAKSKNPVTQETIYEIIYVEIIDDHEISTVDEFSGVSTDISISEEIQLSNNIESKVLTSYDSIKIDSDIPLVSDSDHQRVFPNSIRNMRRRIENVGDRDRDFLPDWMRTIQDFANYELGYTKALVLCYANPGRGESLLSRIRFNTSFASRGNFILNESYQIDDSVEYRGDFYVCIDNNQGVLPTDERFWLKKFNFKDIDFESDRYLIDSVDNIIQDKYLAFPQRGEKLP